MLLRETTKITAIQLNVTTCKEIEDDNSLNFVINYYKTNRNDRSCADQISLPTRNAIEHYREQRSPSTRKQRPVLRNRTKYSISAKNWIVVCAACAAFQRVRGWRGRP